MSNLIGKNKYEQDFKRMVKRSLADALEVEIVREEGWVEVSILFDGEIIDSDSFME